MAAVSPGPASVPGRSTLEPTVRAQLAAELSVGSIWLGAYRIDQPLGDVAGHPAWSATHVASADPVILRALPANSDPVRAEAWQRLQTLDSPHLPRARQVHEVAGARIEVQTAMIGVPLMSWASNRPAPDTALIESAVRQLAAAIGQLHATGLVHLDVRPVHVLVREEHGVASFQLAGLESVTLFDRERPVAARSDPFYAPPETVGVIQHPAGDSLCAWDWWSLGRVLQEFALGQHVYAHLWMREVVPSAPELFGRAEEVLLEAEADGPRAGAVEATPTADPRVDGLLRGLLTSNREARWSREDVEQWLRREPTRDRYKLPSDERLFRWRGRNYTLVEIAELFRIAENWEEAAKQIHEPKTPGTLSHFLGEVRALRPMRERVDELLALPQTEGLRGVAPAIAREIVTALALAQLGGGNLVFRGRRLDGAGLRTLLESALEDAGLLRLMRAFMLPVVVTQVERFDAEAARLFGDLGRALGEAETLALQHGWLKPSDASGSVQLFQKALETQANLRAVRATMQQRFVSSSNPAIDRIFRLPHPSHAELVVLAWMEPSAQRYGFVTHEEAAQRVFATLQQRGTQLTTALFWSRLGAVLRLGPWLFGRWQAVAVIWGILTLAIALAWPGPRWIALALAPLVVAFALRVVLRRVLAETLRDFLPGEATLTLRGGLERCRAGAESAGKNQTQDELQRSLRSVNVEIAQLTTLQPPPAPVPWPPRFVGTSSVVLLTAVAWIGGAVMIGARMKEHRPSWAELKFAWTPPVSADENLSPEALAAAEAAREKLLAEKRARDVAAVKVAWPHRVASYQPLGIKESFDASPAQVAAAQARGHKVSDPYRRDTIESLIAVAVPADRYVGVMLFDGQRGVLAGPRVYLLGFRPLTRQGIEIDGQKAIFLEE